MGRYDLDWIIILFSSILMLLEWKELEESTGRVILTTGPSLENWGSKPSRVIFEASNNIFLGSKLSHL
jgi:hypothetical protein